MTKNKDSKSKVQGEQAKKIILAKSRASKKGNDYKVESLIDHRMTLEEAAKLLNRSVEKIIDYAVDGAIKIYYMVSSGYVAKLTEEQLDMFSKDIDTKIDVPKVMINILCMNGYSTDGKKYVISKKSLRVNEKDLPDLRSRLADEAEDEKSASFYDMYYESPKKKKKAKTGKPKGRKKYYVPKDKLNQIFKDETKEWSKESYATIAKRIIRNQKKESPDDKFYTEKTLKKKISEYMNNKGK